MERDFSLDVVQDLRLRNNVNPTLGATRVLDRAGNHRKKRIVLATSNVFAGMEVRSTLADEDFARVYGLPCKALAAKALSVGIASVTARAEAFLVCHTSSASLLFHVGNSLDDFGLARAARELDVMLLCIILELRNRHL